MSRREFSVATKKTAKERAGDNCECCGLRFSASNPVQYDHEIPCALGGDNSLDNCQVLGKCCHAVKTREEDTPRICKADRLRAKRLGLKPAKRKWPSRKFNGNINWNR